jgi:hypothetical protein
MKNRAPRQPPVSDPPAASIELNLSRHCIQTAVRRRYEKLLAAYFQPGAERSGLEAQIGLLQKALETLDFGTLRSRWPELAGGPAVRVRLGLSAGRIVIFTKDAIIRAPLRGEEQTGGSAPEAGKGPILAG